jgi:hypothetical protein
MYESRDACLIALMKDNAVLQQNKLIDILYQPSDGYRYAVHVPGRRFRPGDLYGTLAPSVENGWRFSPVSNDAKEYLENNPLPGVLIIGSKS